jgi:hypothetical protein
MAGLIFVGAIVWGALSAQFLVQALLSFGLASMHLVALAFSKVARSWNSAGAAAMFAQAILCAALFIGGNWVSADYIDYDSLNAACVASVASFLVTLVYVCRQVPGKILLARFSAWVPYFAEAAFRAPTRERVQLARRYRANPNLASLFSRPMGKE